MKTMTQLAEPLVARWIQERMDRSNPSARIEVKEAYADYAAWAAASGVDRLTWNTLSRGCAALGIQRLRWKAKTWLCGLGIASQHEIV